MSHELRTPLNAVIGFSEVLLDRMFGDINERQDEYLRDIWNSGKHLLELLNEILDLSKVEAGQMVLEPSTFSLSSAVEYCVTMVRERAALHAITVTVEVADGIETIEADELRFKQVVLNLLSNAVKFTPDGGKVSLRAYREEADLMVTVTDTGIGVPVEDQERIFESFQQGRRGAPKEEGTGLGLTLSRRIVWLFGGRMWLKSTPGAGSTFGFSIPRVLKPGDEVSPNGGSAVPTILLVDDDRASLDLNSAYLDGSPTRVLRAKDGVEALEMARKELPAAVVLEIGLPRLDGWQVLAELKADPTTAAIPVVIATAVDDRSRGLALGADAYLRKPIGREELIDALEASGFAVTPRRILVVEDNPLNLKLVRDVLSFAGYDVVEAQSGEEGLRVAQTGSSGSGADGPATPGYRRNRDAASVAAGHARPACAGCRRDSVRDGRGQGTGIARRLRRLRREADQRASASPVRSRRSSAGGPADGYSRDRPGGGRPADQLEAARRGAHSTRPPGADRTIGRRGARAARDRGRRYRSP